MLIEPIRVLMVIGCMGLGGAEAMIMNLYRSIDRSKVQFDFLVHKGVKGAYEGEIEGLGGKIYRIDKYKVSNYFSYVRQLKEHFKAHPEHKIVHCHIGSAAAVCLRTAKKFGAYTIAHSHNTKDTSGSFHSVLWRINSFPTRYVADYFFACSKDAAKDRFGKKVASSDRCRVIYNGIDCDRFTFSEGYRNDIRKEYGIENNFVVGHVGRHTIQKNPLFLLEVFAEVYKADPTVRLLQVGQGELTEQMKQKCSELGIQGAVIFSGAHLDVEKYYSAMDVFLFPSLWEGLGMVAVEAQTNGLHVISSDTVPPLADIGANLFHVMSLKQSAKDWAREILKYNGTIRNNSAVNIAKSSGYDVNMSAEYLKEFYHKKLGDLNSEQGV